MLVDVGDSKHTGRKERREHLLGDGHLLKSTVEENGEGSGLGQRVGAKMTFHEAT